MGIVDDLLANPGVYLGIDRDAAGRGSGSAAAKIVITPLPGGAGVSLDYETFNPADESRLRGPAEHAMVGRSADRRAVLVTGHIHADTVAVLRESEPGVFVLGGAPSPFPMSIKI